MNILVGVLPLLLWRGPFDIVGDFLRSAVSVVDEYAKHAHLVADGTAGTGIAGFDALQHISERDVVVCERQQRRHDESNHGIVDVFVDNRDLVPPRYGHGH